MAKYSTGGSSDSGDGGACELCGATSESLRTANVAGAELDVCPDCRPHDDNAHKDKKKRRNRGPQSGSGSSTSTRSPTNTATTSTSTGSTTSESSMWDGDTSHWEESGTDYDDDQLPYLVRDYGERVEDARQNAGLQRDELADELDVPESDLLAVEQGRATQAGLGGSLIEALEDELSIELVED
jgi:ribosome-binding protein aMBF1 (putative translation factor)